MKYNWSKEINKKININFLKAIKAANIGIENYGATSSKKVTAIHGWIAQSLELIIGEEFIAFANGYRIFTTQEGKKYVEPKVEGKYFTKNIDVGIAHKETPHKIEAVIEAKYHSGNLSQNENNNIENMLGYTANVRGNKMIFGNFIIAKEQTPYYSKDGKLTKMENHSIAKWYKYEKILNEPKSSLHRPDAIAITLVKDGTESEMIKYINSEVIVKETDLRKEMLKNAVPSFVESPNIKVDYLEYGPAHFIKSFAIKILAHHNDLY